MTLHPFHLSVTEIEIGMDRNVEIVINVFADDLEAAINEIPDLYSLDILDHSQYANQMILIEKYLKENLLFRLSDHPMDFTYVGHEIQHNKCIIYIESLLPESKGELFISNSILMNKYEDQKNIIHFKSGRKENSFFFNLRKYNTVVTLN